MASWDGSTCKALGGYFDPCSSQSDCQSIYWCSGGYCRCPISQVGGSNYYHYGFERCVLCPMSWNNWNGNTCFKYISDALARDAADSFCQNEGGRLFSIRMFYDFQGLNSLQQNINIFVCITIKLLNKNLFFFKVVGKGNLRH